MDEVALPENIEQEFKKIVKEAGAILLSYWHTNIEQKEKGEKDIYTQADIASEEFLKNKLGALFKADFLAEESGQSGDCHNGFCWVIDPLDGTVNFAHGISYFCISVALTHNDIPIMSIIYHPVEDELFYARKGKGTFVNDSPISISSPDSLAKSMVDLEFSPACPDGKAFLQKWPTIASRVHSIRYLGSSALVLAHLACGRLDGAILSSVGWWDIAAGILLVQEAGGISCDSNGTALTPSFSTCIAGCASVCNQLTALI